MIWSSRFCNARQKNGNGIYRLYKTFIVSITPKSKQALTAF